jgi:hypothetical protein
MMKKLMICAGLLVSVAAMAADVAPVNPDQVSAADKKSKALLCQQQATEKKLEGAAKKAFLVSCINPAAAKGVTRVK